MYAIVTPTFQPHFIYIERYLQSFDKYLQDPENVIFYFTISRSEEKCFLKVIRPYRRLNIRVLLFEDILRKAGIEQTPDELLGIYKKFSFQTMKKFYTMLYIPERYSLILDSESMAVGSFCSKQIFQDFFDRPFISGSETAGRYLSEFTSAVNHNVDLALDSKVPYWFLENFVWFYDKRILEDMFAQYGSPIQIVQKVYNDVNADFMKKEAGIFEIELYQAYIWKNLARYKYDFFDVSLALHNMLTPELYANYVREHDLLFEGNCGLFERITEMLNFISIQQAGILFKKHNFNIIRCDRTDAGNYKLQKQFMDIVQPSILAASQNHCFGLNATFKNRFRLLVTESKSFMKLQKHGRKFIVPFVFLWKFSRRMAEWAYEILPVLFYSVRFCISVVRNLKTIVRG